jgi:hypothetical protein
MLPQSGSGQAVIGLNVFDAGYNHNVVASQAKRDKNVVIPTLPSKRIGFLSQTYVGKTNDKKIADHESISYPPGTVLYKDTGFQGYEPAVSKTYQGKKSHAAGNSRPLRNKRTGSWHAFGSEKSMHLRA